MVQNVNPTFVKTPNRGLAIISTGTGTGTVTLYTGGANGSKIVGVNVVNISTASASIRFYVSNGGTNYAIGTAVINASAGVDGVNPGINLLTPAYVVGLPIDSDGNNYVTLASSADSLGCNLSATIASNTMLFYTTAGDF